MVTSRQSEPAEDIVLTTPPNREVYIAALERALRDTALALASAGRRQKGLQERLAAIRRVVEQPIPPDEALREIRRILDDLH